MLMGGVGMGTTLQEDLKTYALVFLKSTVFVFLQNLPSPHHLQLCQSELNFLGGEKQLAAIP